MTDDPFQDLFKVELKPEDWPQKYKTHEFERGKDISEPSSGKVTINLSAKADEVLGMAGRMLASSKSAYSSKIREQFKDDPERLNLRLAKIYYNACIFDAEGKQIWFGDLDIYDDINLLQQLANQVGKIYVTPEQPYRWEGIKGHKGEEGVIELTALT